VAAPSPAAAPAQDPFAGVDPSQSDVLRNIARLDPNAATKGAARPAAGTPTKSATLPGPTAASSGAEAVPSAPAASETAAPAEASVAVAARAAADTLTRQAPSTNPTEAAAPAPLAEPPRASSATPLEAPPAPPPPATATTTPAPLKLAPAPTLTVAAASPRRVLAQPRPAFPRDALRDGFAEGRVVADLSVAADGRVTDVVIRSSSPSRSFARAAQQALRDWRYEPAAVASTVQVELVFRAE
jgi:protein TonB